MKVLLIDDHTLFRSGLETLLERHGIEVLDAVGSGPAGLALAREQQADIILLDLRMPEMNGLEVLGAIRSEGIPTPVVILTTSNEKQDLIASLRQGARGYLLKDMEPTELVDALKEIVAGNTVVAPELTGILASVFHANGDDLNEAEPNPFADLTPREMDILCLLAAGQSNKLIARNLGISDGTVKLHVKSILRKLNIHSRVEAAVIAVEQNICQVEPSS